MLCKVQLVELEASNSRKEHVMLSFYFYLLAGLALIALELASMTFYLLVIGVACLLASVSALILHDWVIPTLCAGLLSVIGCGVVYKYKTTSKNDGKMLVDHLGQSVEVVEIHQSHIRVLYSGTYWDATTADISKVKLGDKLKIMKFSNNLLVVN